MKNILLALLFGVIGYTYLKTSYPVFTGSYQNVSSAKYSLSQYSDLADGETYQEAVNDLNDPGNLVAHSGTTDVYQWVNPDGSNMSATFQNGKLISKAQAGLK